MDRKQCSKRYLALFLALVMLIGTLPMNIFAQEPTTGTCTADPNKVSSSSIVKDPDKKQGPTKKDNNGVILEGFDEHGQEYVAADKVITKPADATNQRGVFGRAYDMTGNDFNAADNNNPLPDGTVIYFQWMDSDGVKSPVFTCKTYHVGTGAKDGGWYAYDPDKLDFKDGNGKVHKLAYQTVRQYYRFWLAPGQKSPNGNIWTTARQAPGGQVGFYGATQSAGGTFMVAGFNYQKTAVFVYETPDDISYMVAPKQNSTFTGKNGQTYPRYKIDKVGIEEERGIDNYITGKVWWELADSFVTFPTSTFDTQVPQNTTEDGLKGIRVITSALTAEGANALKNVNNLPINERIKGTKEILTAHPEYIMQTVESPVVYEGKGNVSKYVARFDDNIDLDFIYQFVIDGQGNVLNVQNMSPVPVFSNPGTFVLNTAAKTPFKNALYNVHNALVNDPFKSSIQITNYDTTVDGAASPGDEAKIAVEANYLPGNKVEIVWVDADGNELSAAEVTNKTDAESKTYTVPNNLTEKTAYSVQLRINGIIIDSDSFIADPSTKIRLHRNSSADDKYVDIIKVEDPDSQKVELQALRNTDKYQEVKNKYFVGWSTKKDATQPDENILIDKSTLGPDSTTDLYVRDGSVYKYRDENCVPVKDLYAVWKNPFTVKASKTWVKTAAENYNTSSLKFGLLHRASVGSFGKEVVAGLATYEPVPGQIKDYNANGIVWDNLPSYKEEGKRISYLIVELPTQEMIDKYNAGSTDWKSYNINVVNVNHQYYKKEQTLSMDNTKTNKVDAITSSTKRLHIINGQAVDPHAKNLTAKPGYFDTQGYEITVTNKKQTLTPPSIDQAKSGDKELVINLKAGEDIDGLKGTFTSGGTSTDFVIKKGSTGSDWTITKVDGSAFTGVTVDTTSAADKVVLKLDAGHTLKPDDNLVARTYKTVSGNDVVSSDDTMTVKDNNSRLPKNIKQAYSDKDDKVVITATPFQQDVNGQMITVVPSNTTYTLVDADGNQIAGTPVVTANNNEIKFEIDKDKVSEGTEYFIQAKEPDRDAKDTREVEGVASEKGVASDKSVKLDLTAPQGTIPDIKGFVGKAIDDKTFDITEASEKFNILEKEGPNGLKASINGNQITISGAPTVPYNGQTKLIVEDMFGNKATLTGNANIYAKVVDKVPDGEGANYYSVTFKSDNNSWLLNNDVKINTITKYIIKDFNGDGQVTDDDKITLTQAQDEGLMIPEYEIREGYKEKDPNWDPDFEADGYKFGTDDASFTLQTEKLQSIIPVKPGNDGTLPDTPKGYVRVTLDKDKTVKFKDGVETIYDVRVADKVRYADVYKKVEAQPVDDNYKNVSWYKGDAKVNGSDTITEETTLTAKAENAKNIIPVEDPNANPNPPAGYVRITIEKGDRIESVTGVTTYDVKSDGSVRYGDIIDYVEAEDKKVDATTNAKNGKTQINIAKDNEGNATGKLPYTWKVDNADVVRDAGPGTEAKTLTVSATMLDKDKYNPEGFEQTVKQGDTPQAKDSIKNNGDLPEGTTYTYVKEKTDGEGNKTYTPENPDTSTTGEKDVKVQVTYPDGSTDIVETKIKVVEKAKKISEELEGKLEGKDINVWKDSPVDEINWKDGVKLNDANKGNETYKGYLENATAEEATDPARKTDVVGTKAGQIKVTFEDGSSLLVDKQNLVVKDNILPGDDENAPKDAIEVKFLLGEGVKATKDGAEITGDKTTPAEYASYKIKPGTNLKSYKYAQAPSTEEKTIFEIINATVIDDTYENVVWKGNVTNDPTNYVVSKDNNEFTAYANKKASNKDIIPFVPDKPDDPTNSDDKNVPTEDPDGNPINKDDYVIVAFKIGQPGAATLVLDGKKGEVVSALVKKTDPMKKWGDLTLPTIGQTMDQNNQYTFEKWVDAAKAEMTADKEIADKAVYTATFKTNDGFDKDAIIGFNFVKDPTKMEYNEGDKPKHDGLEIELVDRNNNKVTVTKDKLKDYGITIEPTEDTALTKDDDGKHLVAKITTKDGDGQDKELTASSPGTLTVNDKANPEQSSKPTVKQPTEDDKKIEGKGVPGSKIVVKDKDGNVIGETEVNEKGEWEVPVPADKPLKKDDKITVEQTEKGKKPSTAETTVKGKEDTTANPTIDQPTEGDNKITGKGEPGSKIVVDLPDGTKIPGEVDDNGNWTVDVPADKPLIPGDTIKVTQTDKNGKTKEATATVASRFKPEPIPTPGYNPWWPIYFGSTKTEVKPEPKDLERHEAYIAGYPDGTVRPDGKITRAEVTAILARLTENSSLANFVARFSDVKAFDWFSDSIMKLSAKDIITGYPDGTFKPNKSITRAEFAVIASKYIKNPKAADETFSDVPMNHWAKDAIAKVKAEGWISGYNDGTFKPDAPITRAEAVSIVNRMFNRAADGEFVRDHNYEISNFKDLLESHWAYYDMIEATHTHDFESLNGGIERWEKIVK